VLVKLGLINRLSQGSSYVVAVDEALEIQAAL
jgi:hypothetical protein